MSKIIEWTVYRNPGLMLTHFAESEDSERTFCKHYRLSIMDKILHDPTNAAIWCTDCMSGIVRKGSDVIPA